MVMLLLHRFIIALFFLLPFTHLYSFDKIEIPTALDRMTFYKTHVLGVSKENQLVKLTKEGHVEWGIDIGQQQIQQFYPKFDRLFVLFHSGKLSCYSMGQGLLLWESSQHMITHVALRYPYSYFLTKTGMCGSFEFLTGHHLWLSKESGYQALHLLGDRNGILVKNSSHWVRLDSGTGTTQGQVPLPLDSTSFINLFGAYLLVETPTDLKRYQMTTSEMVSLKKPPYLSSKVYQSRYQVGVLDGRLESMDLKTSKQVWEVSISENYKILFLENVLVVEGEKGRVMDPISGEVLTEFPAYISPILGVIQDKKWSIFTRDAIYMGD